MSRPPVLARAIERGLAPFKGRRAAHLLPRARLGGPMPWVLAIMVALTVVAAGGALGLTNLAERARSDLAGGVTVQIIEADPALRTQQAERALAALRADPAVTTAQLVPEDQLRELIEPWLGGEIAGDVVPLPALIDVRLSKPAAREALDRLHSALAEVAPDAQIDAQSQWLGPVFEAIDAIIWLAFGVMALLAVTGAAAVWLAARNALNANRSTIEVVHLLGGTDRQIARIFQRSVLLDALLGGAVGLVAGMVALAILGAQFSLLDSELVQRGGMQARDWAILSFVPLAAVAIALLTARMTVMASLRKML